MSDFLSAIAKQGPLSEEEQKKAGQAAGTTMGDEHKDFLQVVIGMLDRKEINVQEPTSFIKHENYDQLDEISRSMIDASLVNLANQLRQIEDFYRSKHTPNASPELETMIEHLWQMKDRIESKYGDVLIL